MFSQWNFASSVGQFFGSAVIYTLQKSEELPLAFLLEVFTGYGYQHPLFALKIMIILNVLSVYWFY